MDDVMMAKKIYICFVAEDEDGYDFVALAEDGTCLSIWRSLSLDRAKADMKSPARLERYRAHYGDGFELVWRGGPINASTMPSQVPETEGSVAFIEGRLYQQFLRALMLRAR